MNADYIAIKLLNSEQRRMPFRVHAYQVLSADQLYVDVLRGVIRISIRKICKSVDN